MADKSRHEVVSVERMRIARLLRGSDSMTSSTKELLRRELMARLGIAEEVTSQASLESRQPKAPAATQDVPHRVERTPSSLETAIRRLVEIGAPWARIEGPAWEKFKMSPTVDTAASLVELAFLHGDTADVARTCEKLKVYGKAFWSMVHPAVRAHASADLWASGHKDVLIDIILRDRDMEWLHPVERLFVLLVLIPATDPTLPWMYFRSWEKQIGAAIHESGERFGIRASTIWLALGRAGVDLGYDEEARNFLRAIGPSDPEYDQAVKVISALSQANNEAKGNEHLALLMAQADWRERLKMLRGFFASTRELGGFRDRTRPAFNDLLEKPLDLVPRTSEAWAELSRSLCAAADIESLLPNLFAVFRANALQFHGPTLDPALWQGMASRSPEATEPLVRWWCGVAQLHSWASFGPSSEATLWMSRALVTEAEKLVPVPYNWRDLTNAALGWISRTPHLFDKDRTLMLKQLRITSDVQQVAVADVEEYLRLVPTPPLYVMENLQRVAREKKAKDLEILLVLKHAASTHLRNDDLDLIFRLANEKGDGDLAWRTATILHARGVLHPAARHAWDISGEKRSAYPFQAVPLPQLKTLIDDLDPMCQRLVMATAHVGGSLPELLSILDSGAKSARVSTPPAGSIEAEVEKALGELKWLKPVSKKWFFSFDAQTLVGTTLPAFAHILPANLWSMLVLKICERLGIHSWGWKVSRLHEQIADLIPRVATRQDLRRHSTRVASWLRKLRPDERAAWQDLALAAKSLKDEEAQHAIAVFVTRLATTIMQNHHQAITSLQAMRAPVSVIWQLENWIVSSEYSTLRKDFSTRSKVPVPATLQRMDSLVFHQTPGT